MKISKLSEEEVKELLHLYTDKSLAIGYLSRKFNTSSYYIRKILVERKIAIRNTGFRSKEHFTRYRLTATEYAKVLATRECEICGRTHKLHIDHNHDTGKLRGVLCCTCNVGLGMFKNNPDSLLKAIAYLDAN